MYRPPSVYTSNVTKTSSKDVFWEASEIGEWFVPLRLLLYLFCWPSPARRRRRAIGSPHYSTGMPVLHPTGPGIYASLHCNGMTIVLCVLQFTYFSYDETEVVAMPPGDERWRRLIGRRYRSFASAAQEVHNLVFGTRCDYMRAFYVYCIPRVVDPRIISQTDFGYDRSSSILAAAPFFEAHVQTHFDIKRVADGTPGGCWQPISNLRPAIALDRSAVALPELITMADRLRVQSDFSAALRAAGGSVHHRKIPRLVREFEGGKRARGDSNQGRADSSSASSGSKKRKQRLSDKAGTVVWERDIDAAIAAGRAPAAYIVRDCRKEAPQVASASPKVLLVEPLPVGSAQAVWIHVADLAPMEEHLPIVWHDVRDSVAGTGAAALNEFDKFLECVFMEHHARHATHLTCNELWLDIMRHAGQAVNEQPAFVCDGRWHGRVADGTGGR